MNHRTELPLESWLKTILRIVNDGAEPTPLITRLRTQLERRIAGVLPRRGGFQIRKPLPPLSASLGRSGLRLASALGPSSEWEAEECDAEGYVRWVTARHGHELEGALCVISADPLGQRLRRCDHCGDFFVAKRNHRRKHHFCKPEHRHAFEHAHRDPQEWAAYMREYRRTLRRRRRGRKCS